MPVWAELLFAIFIGGAATALINGIFSLISSKRKRKAQKEDREEEKADKTKEILGDIDEFKKKEEKFHEDIDKRIRKMEKSDEAQVEALKLIMLDRILHLGQSYITKGEITFDDRRRLHEMHDCYHNGLNGNGDARLIIESIDELPLIIPEKTKKAQ